MEERQQESFDEPPHGVVSGTDPRRLYAVIAVLLAVIVVLAIRPWGDDATTPDRTGDGQASGGLGGQAGEPTDTPDASLAAAPTPALPGDAAALAETCGSPSGWRAATLQEWTGRSTPIRSWIAIEPTTATGPLDPAIPFAPVATGIVTAIGYCAPLDEATQATRGRGRLAVGDPRRTGDPAVAPAARALEPQRARRPVEAAGGGERTRRERRRRRSSGIWPPGRYVVELASPGREYHRWLGIEIADLALRAARRLTGAVGVRVAERVGVRVVVRVAGPLSERRAQRRGGSSQMSYAARARMIAPRTEIQNPYALAGSRPSSASRIPG